jgi:Tfp pilus assembly protein FimT
MVALMKCDLFLRSSLAAKDSRRARTHGFSLLEMAIVLSIMMVMIGITFISLQPALKEAHATNAYDSVLVQIRNARAKAVENRQQYIVCLGLTTPAGAATPLGAPTVRSVQVYQWPAGAALSSAIQLSNVDLPSDIQFQALSGLPAAAPDGFGSGTVAIDFDQNVAAAVRNQIMFLPDGSARDTAGNLNSGIVYVAGAALNSTRAITVWGASGRIRGWRLVDPAAPAPWIQL